MHTYVFLVFINIQCVKIDPMFAQTNTVIQIIYLNAVHCSSYLCVDGVCQHICLTSAQIFFFISHNFINNVGENNIGYNESLQPCVSSEAEIFFSAFRAGLMHPGWAE